MKPAATPSALKVQAMLGPDHVVLEFPEGTRTAEDAARAIGCTVAQIVKSLLFRAAASGRPVLALTSGANRADESLLAGLVGESVTRADPAFVRESTGFAIGGVPPVAHLVQPVALIDESLMGFAKIWAAAGTPNAVFGLTPDDLVRLTGGRVAAFARK